MYAKTIPLSESGDVSRGGARPDSGMYSYANAGGTAGVLAGNSWEEVLYVTLPLCSN